LQQQARCAKPSFHPVGKSDWACASSFLTCRTRKMGVARWHPTRHTLRTIQLQRTCYAVFCPPPITFPRILPTSTALVQCSVIRSKSAYQSLLVQCLRPLFR
jgi:hypothetical protein